MEQANAVVSSQNHIQLRNHVVRAQMQQNPLEVVAGYMQVVQDKTLDQG